MKKVTDIDIDFADNEAALQHVAHIRASMVQDKVLKHHNVGVYLHDVPVDPITGFCSIEYKRAEELGFFKMDFLNVGVYKDVESPEHLDRLLAMTTMWEILEDEAIVDGLFHLGGHFNIVNQMKPKSVLELAMVLALIRPAGRHLIGKSWDEIKRDIWKPSADGLYGFKKSHAISYAMVIVVQMNLLVEKASR